jgi:hypothetical protein
MFRIFHVSGHSDINKFKSVTGYSGENMQCDFLHGRDPIPGFQFCPQNFGHQKLLRCFRKSGIKSALAGGMTAAEFIGSTGAAGKNDKFRQRAASE